MCFVSRYTVTVGGTTFTVSKLKEAGYLRTTREVAEKMKDRGEDLKAGFYILVRKL
jgi:hypothetical protein